MCSQLSRRFVMISSIVVFILPLAFDWLVLPRPVWGTETVRCHCSYRSRTQRCKRVIRHQAGRLPTATTYGGVAESRSSTRDAAHIPVCVLAIRQDGCCACSQNQTSRECDKSPGRQHQAEQPETDEEWLSEFRQFPPIDARVCDIATADEERLALICQKLRESSINYDLTIIGRATALYVRQIDLENARHICANTP